MIDWLRAYLFGPLLPGGPTGSSNPSHEDVYNLSSDRSHACGLIVVAGLGIEIVIAVIWFNGWETAFNIIAMILVTLGVWGEIHFAGLARKAGDKQLAEYEARTAKAMERAAKAELEYAKLLSHRYLNSDQLFAVQHEVSAFAPITFSVSIGSNVPEQTMLADSLVHALMGAGWSIQSSVADVGEERYRTKDGGWARMGIGNGLVRGIALAPEINDPKAQQAATALATAILNATGWEVVVRDFIGGARGVTIMIAAKV